MSKQLFYYLFLICFTFFSFRNVLPFNNIFPAHFPAPKYNFQKNPLAYDKVQLGRLLFYDPILSADSSISCATCHSPYTAFTHVDHPVSHGINDSLGFRNAPALVNLAWQQLFMHDGAINNLDMQALAPISHPSEMGSDLKLVLQKLQTSAIYPRIFKKAYNDSIITSKHLLQSIAQFLLTLTSSNAKYDSVLLKRASFTLQEEKGYKLFKKNCSACHTEPLFSNFQFVNNGLPLDTSYMDVGRMRITQNSNDSLKFKVPSLRNIAYSAPYMHDGRFKTLLEVLNHYNKGIVASKTLSNLIIKKMALSSNDKVDIIAFLLTLSDRSFIQNPEFAYPKKYFQKK